MGDTCMEAELGPLMGGNQGGRSQMDGKTQKGHCVFDGAQNRETCCLEESRWEQTNLQEEHNIAVDDYIDENPCETNNTSPFLLSSMDEQMPNVESIPMTTLDEVEYQPKNGPHKNPATSNKICCYGGNIRHLRLAMAIIITLIIIIISLIALLFFNVLNQKSQSSKDFVSKNDSAIYGQDYDYFDYDYSTSSLSYSSPRSPNSGFYRNPGIVYRINPLQFYDSDKDGHGDLNGIRLFIPYFVYIKVKTLIIHPLIQSADLFGNEVSDFYGLNHNVGSIMDLIQLTTEAKKNNISVAVVINANQVSIDHVWFRNSNASHETLNSSYSGFEKYHDYFIWNNCSNGSRPNNWVNIFGKSVWHSRKAGDGNCFYSQTGSRTADLNYLNEEVRSHVKNVLRYWTTTGISQFIFKDAEYMIENNLKQNEIQSGGFDSKIPCNGRYFSPETPTADYVILSPFTSFYTDVDKYSRVIQLTQDSDLEARGILWESTDVSRNVARIQSRLHFPTNIQTVALSYLMPGLPVLLYGDELALESELYQPMPLYIFNQLPMFASNSTSRNSLTLPNYLTMISSLQFTREIYVYKERGNIFHVQKNMVLEVAIELVSSNYLGVAINFGFEPHNLKFYNFAGANWHFEHKIWSTRKSKLAYDVQIASLEVGEVQIILLTLVD